MVELVPGIVRAFDLGAGAQLSQAPVARGRQGDIWQLRSDRGRWAVKTSDHPQTEAGVGESADFQDAAVAAGVPAPGVVRTTQGRVLADLAGMSVRVYAWVELEEPDVGLDSRQLGHLVAALHRVEFQGTEGLDSWYTEPVGASRWRALVAELREARAPFVVELAALLDELIRLESQLGSPSGPLRTCHRDLWADNLRRTSGGGLCVFDFENCGLADPAQELATVLFEFGSGDPRRARALLDAYAEAGGPGRVDRPESFAMAIAQQGHIVETGCRRWLAATTEEGRIDNETWVREFTDRPLTRDVIDSLLSA